MDSPNPLNSPDQDSNSPIQTKTKTKISSKTVAAAVIIVALIGVSFIVTTLVTPAGIGNFYAASGDIQLPPPKPTCPVGQTNEQGYEYICVDDHLGGQGINSNCKGGEEGVLDQYRCVRDDGSTNSGDVCCLYKKGPKGCCYWWFDGWNNKEKEAVVKESQCVEYTDEDGKLWQVDKFEAGKECDGCPSGTQKCGNFCCDVPREECITPTILPAHCSPKECPEPQDDYHKCTAAEGRPACCLKEKYICGVGSVLGKQINICVPKDTGCSDEDACTTTEDGTNVCCTDDEKCESVGPGIKACVPQSCDPGFQKCPGNGDWAHLNQCCPENISKCGVHLDGRPFCDFF